MTKQPRDDANAPMPVLGFKINGGQAINLSSTAVLSTALAISTRVISLYATADCFFEIGNVTANQTTSHFLPAGIYIDVSLGSETIAGQNQKYVSVVSSNTGVLYISERV